MQYLKNFLRWFLFKIMLLQVMPTLGVLLFALYFGLKKEQFLVGLVLSAVFSMLIVPYFFEKRKFNIPDQIWESFISKGFSITPMQKKEIEHAFWDFIEIHKGKNKNYVSPSYVLNEFILTYQAHTELFNKMTCRHLNRFWNYEANPDFRDFKFSRYRRKIRHVKLRNYRRVPAYLHTYHALNKKGRGGGSNRLPDVFLLDWTLENLGGVAYSLREILHIKENYHLNESFKTSEIATTAFVSGLVLEQLFEDYQDDDQDYEPAPTDGLGTGSGWSNSDSSSSNSDFGSSWNSSTSSDASSSSHSSDSYDSHDSGSSHDSSDDD